METDAIPPAKRFEPGEPGEPPESHEPPKWPASPRPDEDGVDVTLLRWMLSLTPAERLEVLQQHVDAVEAIRGAS